MSLIAFIGVLSYVTLTVSITLWRKKFREATNKHDNDYHDKATDSIINYETVKYFTAEAFEIARFKDSVVQFQKFSFATQYSLGFLNFSQQAIIAGTLAGTMLVAGKAVIRGDMNIGGMCLIYAMPQEDYFLYFAMFVFCTFKLNIVLYVQILSP